MPPTLGVPSRYAPAAANATPVPEFLEMLHGRKANAWIELQIRDVPALFMLNVLDPAHCTQAGGSGSFRKRE